MNINNPTAILLLFAFETIAPMAAVVAVPIFAPTAIAIAFKYIIWPVASAVIVRAIVALLDWIITVASAPIKA